MSAETTRSRSACSRRSDCRPGSSGQRPRWIARYLEEEPRVGLEELASRPSSSSACGGRMPLRWREPSGSCSLRVGRTDLIQGVHPLRFSSLTALFVYPLASAFPKSRRSESRAFLI
jgi:hypothetical protein